MNRRIRVVGICLGVCCLIACGKDSTSLSGDSEEGGLMDGQEQVGFVVSYGTVLTVSPLSIRTDAGKVLNVTTNLMPAFKASVGMRVRFNYTVLVNDVQNLSAQVRLNVIQQMLSKVPAYSLQLTEEQLIALGSDPLQINEAWFNDNYLNIVFTVMRSDASLAHSLNLLVDERNSSEELIVLEVRHNAYGDKAASAAKGRVSFLLSDLIPKGKESVRVSIRWTDYEASSQVIAGIFSASAIGITPLVTSIYDEDALTSPELTIK